MAMAFRMGGLALGIGLVGGMTSGCFFQRTNLAETGAVAVEKVSPEPFLISHVRVARKRDKVVVAGVVEPRLPSTRLPLGHVDITIANSEGPTARKFGKLHLPKYFRWARKRLQRSRFEEEFPIIPGDGGKVTIKYHELLHLEGCGSYDEGC